MMSVQIGHCPQLLLLLLTIVYCRRKSGETRDVQEMNSISRRRREDVVVVVNGLLCGVHAILYVGSILCGPERGGGGDSNGNAGASVCLVDGQTSRCGAIQKRQEHRKADETEANGDRTGWDGTMTELDDLLTKM